MSVHPEKIVKETGELPYMPKVVLELLKLLDDPDISVQKLHEKISTDPSLTARILLIANSTFYGRLIRRRNLTQAIITIGLKALIPILLGLSISRMFKLFGAIEKITWRHSVAVSIASSVLAKDRGLEQWEDALICGLLHDIGKIILIISDRDKYGEVIKIAQRDVIELRQAENKVYGFTHMEVGDYASKYWRLPKAYQAVIGSHHFIDDVVEFTKPYDKDKLKKYRSDPQTNKIIAIVNLADHMCQALKLSMIKNPRIFLPGNLPAAHVLGIGEKEAELLLTTIFDEVSNNNLLFD